MASQLKPLRHPQNDLFVIDALDAIIKDDMLSMEYPFYSLSKKPDREIRRFEYKDKWIEFRPSIKGLPTIYDKDLIIYSISHVIAASEEGDEPPRDVEIDPYSFFVFTQRGTGGRDYEALVDSLDRLDGTRFRTNITFDGKRIDEWQGLIDKAWLQTNDKTGKPEKLRIRLSDMVLNSIRQRDVLTLNKDYFRLRKPIERRIYELARKHAGQQDQWAVSVRVLHEKSGSRSSLKEFRRAIKNVIEHDYLPDFYMGFSEDKDRVTFYPREQYRKAFEPKSEEQKTLPPLPDWAYLKAKELARGYDVYALEIDWRIYWTEKGCLELEDHAAAYLGFCKQAARQQDPLL